MDPDLRCWPRRYSFLRSVLLGIAFIAWSASAARAQVMDPTGDADSQSDVVQVQAQVLEAGEGTRIKFQFAQPVSPPLVGYVFIDLDRNPSTSVIGVSPVPGIDALVKFRFFMEGTEERVQLDVMTQTGTVVLLPPKTDKARFRVVGDMILLTLSRDLFKGTSLFDFFICVDTGAVGDAQFDRIPDVGIVDFSSGVAQVKISHGGNGSIDATVADAAGDTPFPDLTGFRYRVVGDRLRVTISYNHSVEDSRVYPPNSKIEGRVYLDVDHRLLTGFANAGESPPSLGVDYALRFVLDPRIPMTASLLSLDSRVLGRLILRELNFGLAYRNDGMASRSGKQVQLDLPLSLLGRSDGDASVRVNSVSAAIGSADALPDAGSVWVAANRVQPLFSCSNAPLVVTDVDRPGPGNNNEELLEVRPCLFLNADPNGDVLILQVKYANLRSALGTAATNVYLDVDQNRATGIPVANANTTIGADYMVSYSIGPNLTSPATLDIQISKIGGQAQAPAQIAAFTLGSNGTVTLSIPMDLLGKDDGNMSLMVETRSGDARLDIVPNTSSIGVSRTSR